MEKINRSFQGVVTSDKMDKTITVLVETHKKHAKYGKRVQYIKKYIYVENKNGTKNILAFSNDARNCIGWYRPGHWFWKSFDTYKTNNERKFCIVYNRFNYAL